MKAVINFLAGPRAVAAKRPSSGRRGHPPPNFATVRIASEKASSGAPRVNARRGGVFPRGASVVGRDALRSDVIRAASSECAVQPSALGRRESGGSHAQAHCAEQGKPVDRAGASATKNRLDPRLERCRVFGQTHRTATGPAIAAVFRPAIPEFGDNRDRYLKYLQTTAISCSSGDVLGSFRPAAQPRVGLQIG